MNKTCPLFFALVAAFAAVGDSLDNIGEVRLKGPLGARLDRMIAAHVAGTDPDYITAPFLEKTETKGWWQTEFWMWTMSRTIHPPGSARRIWSRSFPISPTSSCQIGRAHV